MSRNGHTVFTRVTRNGPTEELPLPTVRVDMSGMEDKLGVYEIDRGLEHDILMTSLRDDFGTPEYEAAKRAMARRVVKGREPIKDYKGTPDHELTDRPRKPVPSAKSVRPYAQTLRPA